jgi:hypothetical protein
LRGQETPRTDPPSPSAQPQPPRLLDQVRLAARQSHLAPDRVERLADFVKQLIFFHDKRHPRDLTGAELSRFLAHLGRVPGLALQDWSV